MSNLQSVKTSDAHGLCRLPCTHDGCMKVANYGVSQDEFSHCYYHAKNGMVNFRGRKRTRSINIPPIRKNRRFANEPLPSMDFMLEKLK